MFLFYFLALNQLVVYFYTIIYGKCRDLKIELPKIY